jgi:predicted DCC family thiol-disulfide oxidoreductase YuxK
MNTADTHSIIIIDDECVLCNKLTHWIAEADHEDKYRITGLKTMYGLQLLQRAGRKNLGPESIILIEGEKVYEASEAVLRISAGLKKYRWLGIFRYIPLKFRDILYYFVAKRRYRLFGKSNRCSMNPKLLKKIIRGDLNS